MFVEVDRDANLYYCVQPQTLLLRFSHEMEFFADSKVVVGLKKGRAVLDQYIDDHLKKAYHVYEAKVNSVSCCS